MPFEEFLSQIVRLAESAGQAVLTEYNQLARSGATVVTLKADQSPLTVADMASHRALADGLAAIQPRSPVLSEEGEPRGYGERAVGTVLAR